MQDELKPYQTGADVVSEPVDLNTAQPIQNFAFGGIANPTQRVFLRGSDKTFLDARQKELDEFEKQRQAYNDALTRWQTEVYNPYAAQVTAYNEAAQRYNTEVYDPYKAQVDAYNAALEQYNREVYDPYAQQYAAYEQAVNAYNAGDRTSDYAGPAAPTLARNFDMTLPTQPGAFDMTAPTAPADFSMERPVLPFNEEEVVAYQQAAAERARKDASNRAAAIDVVSNPEQFNFGAMSVSNRFMAEGGSVDKEPMGQARKMMDDLSAPDDDAAIMRMLSELTSNGKLSQDQILSAVDRVAASGRGGDELLAYLSPESVAVLKRMGGAGTINPVTGLPEFKGGVVGRIGRGIRRLFGRSSRVAVAAEQQGAAEAATPEVAAPAPVEAAAPTGPTAAELLQQVEDANAARRAAEEQLAARTTELTSFQEQAGTRTQEAVDAALRADAEQRATTIAQPVIGTGQITASDMLGQVDRANRMMDPMSPDFVGPRTPEQQAAFDAAQRTPTLNDAIARLPPLDQTTTPPPPPSGSTVPGESIYAPPQSSDGRWFFSNGQWYPNETIAIDPVAPPPVIRDQITPLPGISQPGLPATPMPDVRRPGTINPVAPTPYTPITQIPSVQPLDPEFLRNISRYDPATRRALVLERERDMGQAPRPAPPGGPPDNSGNWRRAAPDEVGHFGIGMPGEMIGGYIRIGESQIPPIGSIGTIPIGGISMPSVPTFGGPRPTGQQRQATSPSNYFAQSQPAQPGGMPGTISAPYNPLAMYQGPSPQNMIAVNPNLSPAMLGGQQNAGVMTDRLGNRIYSPGMVPPGFAKGGQVDLDAMRALVDASNMADEEEGPTVDDYAGEAKRMLASLQPSGQTPKMSRTRLPAGGGAESPKEMAMSPESLTERQDFKPKKARSAQAELRALAKQYALKQRAAENQARGLMQNTLGAPTLEQPTLTKESLSAKRFKEGGAVYRGPKRERGVDAKGRAKVSKEELADFKRLYGQDKTLRDLLNADRTGRVPDVPSELDPRARGLQGANIAPGPTPEQLAQYEAMMRPGRDAIEPMIGPEAALLGGPASARALLAALRGGRRPREEPSRREPTMSRQELDDLMQRMQGEGRSVPEFAKGGEAKKAEEAEGVDGPSASRLLRRLGLAVARGVPQAVTGFVDLAALPLTASGRMRAEDVVGTTDYLTKRGLLPPPQEGLASESAELLSSMASPGGAAKAAMLGVLGPKGLIDAARRSTLFKGKGMTVPEEKFSAQEMLKMLEDQGVDTSRTWLRGKKASASEKAVPQKNYDLLEYIYDYQKRLDAIEAAMRDSRRSQASEGRTLSRQPGDRDVTKFNTKGGVWLTESPALAQTYTGDKGFMIPVYAPRPDVVVDAKGEQWSDFYKKDKDWKEAFTDPKVRLVEVRNVIDAGPHWSSMISPDASEEELRALLTATNLFAKKPFDKRVVNKMTGEPYEYKRGGPVKARA